MTMKEGAKEGASSKDRAQILGADGRAFVVNPSWGPRLCCSALYCSIRHTPLHFGALRSYEYLCSRVVSTLKVRAEQFEKLVSPERRESR